jgi:serine protease Do
LRSERRINQYKIYMKNSILIFLSAMIGGASALVTNHFFVQKPVSIQSSAPPNYPVRFTANTSNSMLPEASTDFIKASDVSLPAVVHVTTQSTPKGNQYYYYDPFRGLGWNVPQPSQPQMASGSGVIISRDGYIVTNNHVIDHADKVEVTLHDKRIYVAKVIGNDPSTDIALLKIEEQNLPYLLYGNSDEVRVGEWVLAVGNPFNLTSTVTAGIVSAKARHVGILSGNQEQNSFPVEAFIQTDAAVNPGNSGGALVNTQGQLIGINSAIASNTGSFTGYSFAVPINLAKKVVNDLIEFGKVQRAFLGIGISDIDSKLVQEKRIKNTKGVYVTGIADRGAANDAGMKEGDVILQIGEIAVNNTSELQEQVSRYRPGDNVIVKVRRGEEEKTLSVTLKNRNGDTSLSEAKQSEVLSLLGATFESLPEGDRNKLGLTTGVKITSLDAGKLRAAGIQSGFIITSIDKKRVSSLDDVKAALANKEGGVLIEGVYSNGMKAYYAFGL